MIYQNYFNGVFQEREEQRTVPESQRLKDRVRGGKEEKCSVTGKGNHPGKENRALHVKLRFSSEQR